MKATLGMILMLLCVCAPAQTGVGRRAVASTAFQQLAELTGAQPGDGFGSVAISGDVLVVGAALATTGCNGTLSCGAAYVYTATNGDWSNLTLVATLTQSNGMEFGGFGQGVAFSGDTIVVTGTDSTTQEQAAYVFVEPTSGWQDMTQTAELTISGAPPFVSIYGVAIDGDTVVVGTPFSSAGHNESQGTAFVYVKPTSGWANMTQTAQLFATDGGANFNFGWSVGISGRNVAVGAPGASVGGVLAQGLAYLFVEPANGWGGIRGQTTELQPSNATRKAGFGLSISVGSSTIAVGAPNQSVGSHEAEGAAYVFVRPATGWPNNMTETAQLTATKGTSGEGLGLGIALSGKALVAGATGVRGHQGVVYLFLEPSGGWQNMSSADGISSADGASDNEFVCHWRKGQGYWPWGLLAGLRGA